MWPVARGVGDGGASTGAIAVQLGAERRFRGLRGGSGPLAPHAPRDAHSSLAAAHAQSYRAVVSLVPAAFAIPSLSALARCDADAPHPRSPLPTAPPAHPEMADGGARRVNGGMLAQMINSPVTIVGKIVGRGAGYVLLESSVRGVGGRGGCARPRSSPS